MTDIQKLKQDHSAAIRELNKLSVQERVGLLIAAENDELQETENAKTHPLTRDKFSPQECAELKAHFLDGGGVREDKELCKQFVAALLDEDWPTVFKHIPHVIKCYLKMKGIVVPTVPGEGVILTGVGPTTPNLVNRNDPLPEEEIPNVGT